MNHLVSWFVCNNYFSKADRVRQTDFTRVLEDRLGAGAPHHLQNRARTVSVVDVKKF